MSSSASSEPVFSGGGRTRALTVRRSPAARRMRLAVDPRDGSVRLTLPGRASLKTATRWVEGHRAWIERALTALPEARPFRPGATLPLEGRELAIDWAAGHPRTVSADEVTIRVGGPEEMLSARLTRWLRGRALDRLTAETRRYAELAGVPLGRVAVGDPRTRWGSCSAAGDIRYSWRLILAPPAVLEATVAHEVAHRLHMHHGREFHEAVARLLGREPDAERAWLRRNGAGLYWVGRAD